MTGSAGSGIGKLPPGQAFALAGLVECSPGSVVSRTIAEGPAGTLTLFAFDADQGLSEHSAPYDAFVQILDGTMELMIGGKKVQASAGDVVVMPANVPHSLRAEKPVKMLLTMIRSGG